MHPVEITTYLDDQISALVTSRLPEEPGYPAGDAQYASFMISSDEMNVNGKNHEKTVSSGGRSNGNWSDDSKPIHDRYDTSIGYELRLQVVDLSANGKSKERSSDS